VALTDPPAGADGQSRPEAGRFFDARRGVYYSKPLLRGWLHLFWFGASLVLGIILLASTRGHARITAGAITAVTGRPPGGGGCSGSTT
jgi:hemolysin III